MGYQKSRKCGLWYNRKNYRRPDDYNDRPLIYEASDIPLLNVRHAREFDRSRSHKNNLDPDERFEGKPHRHDHKRRRSSLARHPNMKKGNGDFFHEYDRSNKQGGRFNKRIPSAETPQMHSEIDNYVHEIPLMEIECLPSCAKDTKNLERNSIQERIETELLNCSMISKDHSEFTSNLSFEIPKDINKNQATILMNILDECLAENDSLYDGNSIREKDASDPFEALKITDDHFIVVDQEKPESKGLLNSITMLGGDDLLVENDENLITASNGVVNNESIGNITTPTTESDDIECKEDSTTILGVDDLHIKVKSCLFKTGSTNTPDSQSHRNLYTHSKNTSHIIDEPIDSFLKIRIKANCIKNPADAHVPEQDTKIAFTIQDVRELDMLTSKLASIDGDDGNASRTIPCNIQPFEGIQEAPLDLTSMNILSSIAALAQVSNPPSVQGKPNIRKRKRPIIEESSETMLRMGLLDHVSKSNESKSEPVANTENQLSRALLRNKTESQPKDSISDCLQKLQSKKSKNVHKSKRPIFPFNQNYIQKPKQVPEKFNIVEGLEKISQRAEHTTESPHSHLKGRRAHSKQLLVMNEFQSYDDLIIKKSAIHGLGIFTPIEIPKDSLIMEYKGEIIGKCVSNKREQIYRRNNIQSVYMFSVSEDMIVDATFIGNKARYINHSCNPNCEAIYSAIDRSIKYCTIKNIDVGEELTINYNMPNDSTTEACNCNNANCQFRN